MLKYSNTTSLKIHIPEVVGNLMISLAGKSWFNPFLSFGYVFRRAMPFQAAPLLLVESHTLNAAPIYRMMQVPL